MSGSTRKWRKLRALILARDRGVCAYCGGPADQVDHVISVLECRRRGIYPDHPVNLVAACGDCNRRKGGGSVGGPAFFRAPRAAATPLSDLSPLSPPTPTTGQYLAVPDSSGPDRPRTGLELDDPGPLGRGVAR